MDKNRDHVHRNIHIMTTVYFLLFFFFLNLLSTYLPTSQVDHFQGQYRFTGAPLGDIVTDVEETKYILQMKTHGKERDSLSRKASLRSYRQTSSRTGRSSSSSPKKEDILAKFRDTEDDEIEADDFASQQANRDSILLEDEFETLKLNSPKSETLKSKSNKNELRPQSLFSTSDLNDDKVDSQTLNRRRDTAFETELNKIDEEDLGLSPTTGSLSSRRRTSKTLSDFSEGTNDTDVTSELDDKDFANLDDVDNIFGNEESGIYSTLKPASKANQRLQTRKNKMKQDAELEEQELSRGYLKLDELKDTKADNEVKHLKSRSPRTKGKFSVSQKVPKGVDYENFEDGFDLDGPVNMGPDKVRSAKGNGTSELATRKSIAVLSGSQQPTHFLSKSTPLNKKYKSTMDLAHEIKDPRPSFNNNNSIMSKLNRIPSFYKKDEKIEFSKNQVNQDIELKKQQLLNKYREMTECQSRLNRGSKSKISPSKRNKTKKIGLLRCLNEHPVASGSVGQMYYNDLNKKWEGNDIDMVKFDNNASVQKPLLISRNEFEKNNCKIEGNMIYDPDKMKWINLDPEERDVFSDLNELDEEHINRTPEELPSPKGPVRGISTFTRRTESSTTNSSSSDNGATHEFDLPVKLIERFYREEARIQLKTCNWFAPKDEYSMAQRYFNRDYIWEIGRMVNDYN